MLDAVFWSTFATLFFVLDPFGNVPLFNSLLKSLPPQRRARVIAREMLIALLILLGFLWLGQRALAALGLSSSALNLSGGIILFIIALRMVFPGRGTQSDGEDFDDPMIVPLAIPMIAGPSAIAIVMLVGSNEAQVISGMLALLAAWGLTALILITSPAYVQFLGDRGLRAVERLMGMLLIMMAVQMLLNGVTDYLSSLPARL